MPIAQHTIVRIRLERYMKKLFALRMLVSGLAALSVFSSAPTAAQQGKAMLTSENRSYVGTYSTADKHISVDIDGLVYQGHYASHTEDFGRATDGTTAGGWGRAFLFASSARVLQCALKTELPNITGQCQGSDGRNFQLTTETRQKDDPSANVPATK